MGASTKQPTWTLYELLHAADVCSQARSPGFNPEITSLAVDSRRVEPGACFVALRGAAVDGHDYVDQALQSGAAVVVVEAGRYEGNSPQVVDVPNTHDAVARFASAFYGIGKRQRAGELTLIGVTGTNGKTTVCSLIQSVLRAAGKQTACLGTIRNDLVGGATDSTMTTLPPIELCAALAAAADAGATHAVLEVSSHALDQRRCAGLDFTVGVFTNLTQDHLDYHGSMDAYAATKKRLFDGLSSKASAVVCADDDRAGAMVSDCAGRVIRYGLRDLDVDLAADGLVVSASGSHFTLRYGADDLAIDTPMIGRHNVQNILAAAGAAQTLGIDSETCKQGIEAVTCVPGRLQRVESEAPFTVFVDYAHTPDALENVLGVLRDVAAGRLLCVFGCGGDRDRGKRALMGAAVGELADIAIVTSDNPRTEDPQTILADTLMGMGEARGEVWAEEDRQAAIEQAVAAAQPGDTVLIAGKGHETYQIVGDKRLHFDDAVVAADALRRRREVA